MDIKVIIHGTEIVTVAKKNYEKYKTAVERMKYYAALGVEFRVCALAAQDYDYTEKDFQDFIKIVPSAITELAHWQQQGYALIRPIVMDKKFSVEEIR
jgi:intracellular sulfur oxidation DsrE/DsrF family protein